MIDISDWRDSMIVWFIASILVLSVLATVAAACLNDRDTLAAEVDRKPDLIWVLVARIERIPPL